MKIELETNLQQYEEFVKDNSCTFYQSIKHLKFLESLLKINTEYFIAKENENIIGVLPFFRKKTKFGVVINSLPFFGSYGGIISERIDAKKNILNFFNEQNAENDILSSVIISNPFESSEIYEKYYKFNDRDERMIQCVNLSNVTKSNLWTNFEQRVRRAIRKAEKNLVSVEYPILNNQLLDDFYKLHVSNISSKNGIVKPNEFFLLLKDNFLIRKDYDILAAVHETKPIALCISDSL